MEQVQVGVTRLGQAHSTEASIGSKALQSHGYGNSLEKIISTRPKAFEKKAFFSIEINHFISSIMKLYFNAKYLFLTVNNALKR